MLQEWIPWLSLQFLLIASASIFAAIIVYCSSLGIYNIFFHPLRKYPGPKLWAASRAPFALSLARGNLVHDTHKIHKQYGPVVRLAPNELSFIEANAWSDIYSHRVGHSEFTKNPIWTEKTPNGEFSVINAFQEDHSRQRKVLNHAFSPQALKAQEPLIQGYISLLIQKIQEQELVNITDWITYCTFDIVGDLMFGKPFGCLMEGKYHDWVSYLFSNLKAACLMSSVKFYPLLSSILYSFIPKKAFEERQQHFDLSTMWVRQRIRAETDRADFLKYILENNNVKEPMTTAEIEASASVLVLAGSETTSTQLLGTIAYLLQHPDKLSKLVHEVRSTFQSESEITLRAVDSLSYLKAVLQENSRMAPSVPGQVPRMVPKGGDTVCGINIPEDTFVGVPQYPAYRSATNFAFPDSFIPERWLQPDDALFAPTASDPHFDRDTFAADARAVLQPFSVGPRNCIGRFLAHAEMRLILARLIWCFDIEMPRTDEPEKRATIEKPWDCQRTYALWERKPKWVRMRPVTRDRKM